MAAATHKRRELILEEVQANHSVYVSELSKRFGISEVSIRRDLDQLERNGLVKRVHGGAVALANDQLGRSHTEKLQQFMEEKERIGRAAVDMIQPDERIFFDSGTTVAQVARSIPKELLQSGNLTIITGSIPVVQTIGHWKSVQTILLGGIYLSAFETTVGPQTINVLQGLHADKMFLGTDGVTLSHGLTTANILEAEVDQAMVNTASEIIAVADSSKIGVAGLTTIIPVERLDKLITDKNAPSAFVDSLREQGVEVILV